MVDKYIEALQIQDKDSIENLIAEGLDPKTAISEKLKLYKDTVIEVESICYKFGDKTSIVDTVFLEN